MLHWGITKGLGVNLLKVCATLVDIKPQNKNVCLSDDDDDFGDMRYQNNTKLVHNLMLVSKMK